MNIYRAQSLDKVMYVLALDLAAAHKLALNAVVDGRVINDIPPMASHLTFRDAEESITEVSLIVSNVVMS